MKSVLGLIDRQATLILKQTTTLVAHESETEQITQLVVEVTSPRACFHRDRRFECALKNRISYKGTLQHMATLSVSNERRKMAFLLPSKDQRQSNLIL